MSNFDTTTQKHYDNIKHLPRNEQMRQINLWIYCFQLTILNIKNCSYHLPQYDQILSNKHQIIDSLTNLLSRIN